MKINIALVFCMLTQVYICIPPYIHKSNKHVSHVHISHESNYEHKIYIAWILWHTIHMQYRYCICFVCHNDIFNMCNICMFQLYQYLADLVLVITITKMLTQIYVSQHSCILIFCTVFLSSSYHLILFTALSVAVMC